MEKAKQLYKNVRNQFNSLDSNNDGLISFQELHRSKLHLSGRHWIFIIFDYFNSCNNFSFAFDSFMIKIQHFLGNPAVDKISRDARREKMIENVDGVRNSKYMFYEVDPAMEKYLKFSRKLYQPGNDKS